MEIVRTSGSLGVNLDRRSPVQSKVAPPQADFTPRESVLLTGSNGLSAPQQNAATALVTSTEEKKNAEAVASPSPSTSPSVITVMDTADASFAPKDTKFLAKYGPWGVVTGASQGIGLEFAHSLAEKGMNVALVARSADKLDGVAKEIRQQYGVEVQVIAADLSKPEGLETVKNSTENLEIGMLVNNAGSWQFGSFLDNNIQRDLQSVALNVEAPMVLSHHFAGKMAGRGKGGVINVGSGAALHGVPGQAAYSATKGFLLNFTESLYRELKPKGVDVIITNPGPVMGEASSAYDQSKVPLPKVTGKTVADDAIGRLGRGSKTIPGWLNKIGMGIAIQALPRDLLTNIAGHILEKATPAQAETPAEITAVDKPAAQSGTTPKALLATSEEAAKQASGGILGYLWGAATAIAKPITSVFSAAKFALGFVGDMRTRAEEISASPDKVEDQLKAAGLHHEYQPPQNAANVKLEGKMVIKANMSEFFELWNSWISKGYGSINDRKYADLVLKFRDQAKEIPLLAHVPMTSEDTFSVEIVNGRMSSMKETTVTKFAGLIPSSRVEWMYHRETEPTASNSFEKTIDNFNGDVGKMQAFYQDLFDPRKVNPDSKATVDFIVTEVDAVDHSQGQGQEFTHSVNVPLGGILPKPESTLKPAVS